MYSRCKRRSLSQNSTQCTLDNKMGNEDVYSISSDACVDKMPMCSCDHNNNLPNKLHYQQNHHHHYFQMSNTTARASPQSSKLKFPTSKANILEVACLPQSTVVAAVKTAISALLYPCFLARLISTTKHFATTQ